MPLPWVGALPIELIQFLSSGITEAFFMLSFKLFASASFSYLFSFSRIAIFLLRAIVSSYCAPPKKLGG
jgi:hypothetical protein